MSETIIIENNSGFWSFFRKIVGSRAFLGMLAVLLIVWRVHDWWWQEDVCAARYNRADATFKKQTARENAHVNATEKGAKQHAFAAEIDRKSRHLQASQLGHANPSTAILPKKIHGAIQEIR